jgi:hypothetical protein
MRSNRSRKHETITHGCGLGKSEGRWKMHWISDFLLIWTAFRINISQMSEDSR